MVVPPPLPRISVTNSKRFFFPSFPNLGCLSQTWVLFRKRGGLSEGIDHCIDCDQFQARFTAAYTDGTIEDVRYVLEAVLFGENVFSEKRLAETASS